jgi:hypothetical protein
MRAKLAEPSAGLDVLFAVRKIEEAGEEQFCIAADLQTGNPSKQPDELRIGGPDAVFLHTDAALSCAGRRSLGIKGGCTPFRSRP